MTFINAKVIRALEFAAQRHTGQMRKGHSQSPYINHPIAVVSLLVKFQEYDADLLSAAALHDVIEDTARGETEIQKLSNIIQSVFGKKVLTIILEVSDDKNVPFHDRKEKQILNTPYLSVEARKIKIADKTNNIEDMTKDPPKGWSNERKTEYLDWAEKVIEGAKGINIEMEDHFEITRRDAYQKINQHRNR